MSALTTPWPAVLRGWGDFGGALCGHLADVIDDAREEPPTTDPWEDLLIAVFWRDRWQLGATLDDVAYERDAPWLPLTVGPTHLLCGPLVHPGHTVCWHCAIGAATSLEDESRSDDREMTSDPDPPGFLRVHLTMAEEALRALLDDGARRALSVDLLRPALGMSATPVGHNGCPRCSTADASLTSLPPLELGRLIADD